MHYLKEAIKKIIPVGLLAAYHRSLAQLAAMVYRHPSREMIVIGITGTKGKSTTGFVLWQLLTAAGYTVGLTGTIETRIGAEVDVDTTAKMTMAGRFTLQKLLRRMVSAGCEIAIVETTSIGIAQSRHIGIAYDICMFTNLHPEHLDAHGGFENYKAAKKQLFTFLDSLPEKILPSGKRAPRASVVNMDSEYGAEFAALGSYQKIRVGSSIEAADGQPNGVMLHDVVESIDGTQLALNDAAVSVPLLGAWNAWNVGLAIVAASSATGKSFGEFVQAAGALSQVPGRMEFIREDQSFSVIVDYAYEPESLELLYTFCRRLLPSGGRLLTTISSTGGGRDVARRFKNGEVAGRLCDVIVVTDEDPYDDDPLKIMQMVEEGVVKSGKVLGENYFVIPDRRDAIAELFDLATANDVVLLTCKGAETKMAVAGGQKIEWDDRVVAREILAVK